MPGVDVSFLDDYEPGPVRADDIVRGELFGAHSAQRPFLEDLRTVSAFADVLASSIGRTIASGQEVDGDVTYEGVKRVLCDLLEPKVDVNVELADGESLGTVMGRTKNGIRVSPVSGGKTVEVLGNKNITAGTQVVFTLSNVKREGAKRMAFAELVRAL